MKTEPAGVPLDAALHLGGCGIVATDILEFSPSGGYVKLSTDHPDCCFTAWNAVAKVRILDVLGPLPLLLSRQLGSVAKPQPAEVAA